MITKNFSQAISNISYTEPLGIAGSNYGGQLTMSFEIGMEVEGQQFIPEIIEPNLWLVGGVGDTIGRYYNIPDYRAWVMWPAAAATQNVGNPNAKLEFKTNAGNQYQNQVNQAYIKPGKRFYFSDEPQVRDIRFVIEIPFTNLLETNLNPSEANLISAFWQMNIHYKYLVP